MRRNLIENLERITTKHLCTDDLKSDIQRGRGEEHGQKHIVSEEGVGLFRKKNQTLA